MFTIRTNNRKAISVVMTTMIILVASVVLGTGVVIYGTSLFQTGGQQQSIASQGLKLWINSTTQTLSVATPINYAWGAAAIRNNGDTLASVNTIQIRGATVPFSSWFVDANQTRINSGTNFQSQFNLTRTENNGYLVGNAPLGVIGIPLSGNVNPSNGIVGLFPADYTHCDVFGRNTAPNLTHTAILIDEDALGPSSPLCLSQSSGPTALSPGQKMIVYFQIPTGVIGPIDSGSAVTVNIYAGNVGGPTTVQVGNP